MAEMVTAAGRESILAPVPLANPGKGLCLRNLWFLSGLALMIVALTILEWLQPYYFCQDDVLVAGMPRMLHACRSVWSGVIPEYNPYNLLGSPGLVEGDGGTYPPLYLAYAIARHVLHDEGATADVFAIVHLLLGYVVMYVVGRRLGLRGMVACLVALSFVLSGPILIMGRSWHAFVLPAVLSPLLVLAADRLRTGPIGWRWVAWLGLVIGLYYHGGFPQLAMFGVAFFALHVATLMIFRLAPFRRVLWAVPAILVGVALMLPLLYQQWRLSSDLSRTDPDGVGVGGHLMSFVAPYPICRERVPLGHGSLYLDYGGHSLYFGTLLAVLFVLSTGEWFASLLRIWRPPRGMHVFTLVALVALWLSLGPQGGLWQLTRCLPFGLRNHPFRVTPFVVMFSVLSGGLMLERLLRKVTRRRAWETAIWTVASLLLLYHVTCARTAFYSYGFRPYPQLPAELVSWLRSPDARTPFRSLCCAPQRSVDPSYAYCLPHGLATVYQFPNFFGYDPLVENKSTFRKMWDNFFQDVGGACRAYGLRWLLLHRSIVKGHPFSPSESQSMEKTCYFLDVLRKVAICHQHPIKSLDESVLVLELAAVDPLCFYEDDPSRPLPLRMSGRGIEVELANNSQQRRVVINFLYYPDMRAYADAAPTPVGSDKWWRMVVAVPPGTQTLSVLYQPPWSSGLAWGAAAALLAIGSLLALKQWDRSAPARRPSAPGSAAFGRPSE